MYANEPMVDGETVVLVHPKCQWAESDQDDLQSYDGEDNDKE